MTAYEQIAQQFLERSARQWRDAAGEKGLESLKVVGDAVLILALEEWVVVEETQEEMQVRVALMPDTVSEEFIRGFADLLAQEARFQKHSGRQAGGADGSAPKVAPTKRRAR